METNSISPIVDQFCRLSLNHETNFGSFQYFYTAFLHMASQSKNPIAYLAFLYNLANKLNLKWQNKYNAFNAMEQEW